MIQQNDKMLKRYIKSYWRVIQRALVKSRASIVERAEYTSPEDLKSRVETLLNTEPVMDVMMDLWLTVGGRFGYDTFSKIRAKKSGVPMMEYKADDQELWKGKMRKYASERSLQKVGAIMSTEAEAINSVIDGVIKQVATNGLGIPETRKLMRNALKDQLLDIENWQAQRIAMTEVGSAANTGSFQAANEVEGVKKQWMFIPGMKTFRPSHQSFEADGAKEMSFEYAPGLAHPGDIRGSAEHVINCYCSIGYIV